jgi:hypothetical protein
MFLFLSSWTIGLTTICANTFLGCHDKGWVKRLLMVAGKVYTKASMVSNKLKRMTSTNILPE